MCIRDSQRFREKLVELVVKVVMYKRYIDDQNLVVEAICRVVRFNKEEGRMEQVEGGAEEEVADDRRTFEMLREIADTIDPIIQLTVDYPSNHTSGRVPILDLEVWMERNEDGFSQVRWSFYEKREVRDDAIVGKQLSRKFESQFKTLSEKQQLLT